MTNQNSWKLRLLNILGGIGYVAMALQYIWSLMVFLPTLVSLPALSWLFRHDATRSETVRTVASSSTVESWPLLPVAGLILGLLALAGIFYVLFMKIPRSISHAGQIVAHKPVEVIAPIITKHVEFSKKDKKKLSATLLLAVKLFLVFLPLCVLLLCFSIPSLGIEPTVVMIVGIFLWSWSIAVVLLQYLLALFFKIDYSTVR